LVWRDRLAWVGAPGTQVEVPIPLILFDAPSITRAVALEAVERAGLTWRIACTSGSLSGLRAACLAGLGVTVHARGLMPEGLVEMPPAQRLPQLGDVEFVVLARTTPRGPAAALAQAILANGDRLQRAGP
jgi:DNA-binding transcriptional LysR family regulator